VCSEAMAPVLVKMSATKANAAPSVDKLLMTLSDDA